MTENSVAKTLRILGILEMISGVILAIFLWDELEIFGIAVVVAGFISGMMFIGFAEIIRLLQINADKQDLILKKSSGSADVAPAVTYDDLPAL